MCTSRAFGKLTGDYHELKEATSNYAARLAGKLRREKLCTTVLSVKLLTNKFIDQELQAYPSITIPLEHPVNNTPDLINTAHWGLNKIYLMGYQYQKVEVNATGLIPESEVQLNIFSEFKGKKYDQVSRVLDQLNSHYGAGHCEWPARAKTKNGR
ncbi:hypothetical protein [Pedobacter jeongneungensis]|uniref:DinB/UmuC family translesion DNA polymerase n=1 Tax=Pedobacter jeongneungensis TaxID=947309 RepID=UPI000468C3B2|nr:hypothetical protein [Pedobacter jeongneungensis]